MIACYILYSPSLDKFYTGITQQNVEGRLLKHNNAEYGTHFTAQVNDWQVFLTIPCNSVSKFGIQATLHRFTPGVNLVRQTEKPAEQQGSKIVQAQKREKRQPKTDAVQPVTVMPPVSYTFKFKKKRIKQEHKILLATNIFNQGKNLFMQRQRTLGDLLSGQTPV